MVCIRLCCCSTPSWITDHQDVSTFQVYSEMISQRVSQVNLTHTQTETHTHTHTHTHACMHTHTHTHMHAHAHTHTHTHTHTQGFQLVIEPKPGRSGSEESLFSLYHSLKELNEMTSQTSAPGSRTKKKRRFQDVSVKLSLGRVFQKVELNYPDLIIWIYRPKYV